MENTLLLRDDLSLKLGFDLQPAIVAPWQVDGDGQWSSGEYRLVVRSLRRGDIDLLAFVLSRSDQASFTVERYRVEALLPCVDLYNVPPRFMGYAHVSHFNGPQILTSTTTKDFPYVIYASRSGENRLAIGLKNQLIETMVTRTGKGGHMYYDANRISFDRPVGGVKLHLHVLEDIIFISQARKTWFDVTRDYWDWIDAERGYVPNPTPPSAFGPCWCSWLHLTDINEQKIWDSAVACRDLGIKTIMIDAGWFCPDTDVPFPDSPLTDDTFGFGRVSADRSKFPDMAGLVRRIHEELGLYIWAWATPRWAFRAVETGPGAVDQRLLDCRIRNEKGEIVPMLCTRHPNSWEHAARFTAHLLQTYGFDGLKFDCWELDEGMAVCTADHEHAFATMGEGTREWASRIFAAMQTVNPDAVVWFNNTTLKPYSNYSVSPNEIYCHPDENWRMSVVLKTYTHGIVSQLCEGSWHDDESDANVSRHLAILMMGHVPEVQVDVTTLRDNHKRIVQAWLAFYQQHRDALLFGDYRPFGFEFMAGGAISTTPPHVRIDAPGETFVWVGPVRLDEIILPVQCFCAWFFNEQNIDRMDFRIKHLGSKDGHASVFGFQHERLTQNASWQDGLLTAEVPVGAFVRIDFDV